MTSLLAISSPLMAQTRARRNPPPPPAREPATDATAAPDTTTTTPTPKVPINGAGTVIPPNQGYYVNPAPTPPGTAANFDIQANPLDRAYWEMYDREKTVTLSGKVTRVDWTMPNSYVYLVAEGALWAVESAYIQFRQSNITPAIRVDDWITITGYFPKEEPWGELPAKLAPPIAAYLKTNHLIRAGSITTATGVKLNMGRPPTEQEMSERLKCSPFGC
jgi:hypothetical protein